MHSREKYGILLSVSTIHTVFLFRFHTVCINGGTYMSYLITHWCDVPAKFFSEERIKEVIDCGINLVMGAYGVEMNRQALEYC